ncbi:MAG: hypothetical protein E7322_02605 [Clostridiales bacterium]|nr:hypothetical protein [Clostridiales bacterium]
MENILVNVLGGEITENEKKAYIERGIQKYGRALKYMDLKLDGDFVDIHYHLKDVPFDRIRRITGYLVGTLDRFNNAKRAEESQRVKHKMDIEGV